MFGVREIVGTGLHRQRQLGSRGWGHGELFAGELPRASWEELPELANRAILPAIDGANAQKGVAAKIAIAGEITLCVLHSTAIYRPS